MGVKVQFTKLMQFTMSFTFYYNLWFDICYCRVLMARWDPQEGPVNSENQDPQVTMVHPAKWAHRYVLSSSSGRTFPRPSLKTSLH